MMFRLEFNEIQQGFHMEWLQKSYMHPENTNGWITICDSIEDRMGMEFIFRMNEKYDSLGSCHGSKRVKKINTDVIKEEFSKYIKHSTNVNVIEINKQKGSPDGLRCPVIYQIAETKGICSPCPYCGESHVHSIGSGHRLRHCKRNAAHEKVKCFDMHGEPIEASANYYVILLSV